MSKVACTIHTLWTTSDFKRLQLHKYNILYVQQILVVTFEFTGAARGFMIMSCAARGVKKVGQHCFKALTRVNAGKGVEGRSWDRGGE